MVAINFPASPSINDLHVHDAYTWEWDGVSWNSVSPTALISITKSLTLTVDWQDTGINSTDLATGTYVLSLYANDLSAGGENNNEYYSGIVSWYSGTTDSSLELPTDEVILHRAGAGGEAGLFLRTYRSEDTNPDALRLQIYSNTANASASNYVFTFKRLI